MTKLPPRLRVVDEPYTASRRASVLAIDAFDFAQDVTRLEDQGLIVINADEDRLVDEVDLRLHVQCLAVADDIVLPDTWWTSSVAHQLVTLAGWMRLRFITVNGVEIPTVATKKKAR